MNNIETGKPVEMMGFPVLSLKNVRAKGRQIGRPQGRCEDIPASFLRHYPAYKSKQLNVSELARVCDISRTTAYKYIGLLEA